MEHEVFVPVEVQSLRQTLRDPARVARCVPGLQQDAGEPPVAGRLKLRVEGHTITYRGTLRITELDEDTFGVEAQGTEARGTGAAKFSLTLRLAAEPEGTRLAFTATATADGRIATATPEGARASAARLLDRFGAALAADADAAAPGDAPGDEPEADPAGPTASGTGTAPGADASDGTGHSVFDAVVPPPSLDPLAEEEFDVPGDADYVPAEAAHARRTMIGRSAEEVDHAPPRGRYAPVPAPAGSGAGATLRWAAPAAALALASAVVVGRVLRRRR
ncbi:SRPBCC domain-containing protein [Streptomyces melanogenes]|uniref:SRPBCC domain-containing protein n=1 Tax=Streptomyces melanogenes TaxID=67326 RepID=A0ABZ1XKR8_9ACTN|nr:SRPBCC domain-containing protein [Streptomyces melanogenes]